MSEMNLNLLPSKAKFQAAKIQLQSKIRLVMIIITGIWAFTVGGLLVANFVVKTKVSQVKAAGAKIQANYAALQDNIVSSQQFKYKTKMVGEVLLKRFEYGKAFEMVTTMFPGGIVVKSFDLQESGVFEIKGEAQGSENVNQLENIVEKVNSGQSEKFAFAKLKTLGIMSGVWTFTMEVKLK